MKNEEQQLQSLKERTKEFALRIIRLYSALPQTTVVQVIGKQVLRSGTSVGAHYREAYRSRSKAEFISKHRRWLARAGRNMLLVRAVNRSQYFSRRKIKAAFGRSK